MAEVLLSLQNLNKSFGKRKVIDDLSFDVQAGEIFGFLGPNGAGKTTTIKMVMGFLREDSGSILIKGLDLRKQYEKAMSHLGGIVENPEMYGYLSGRTNLEMYARLHTGVTPARIDEVVHLVGMQQRIDDRVKKFSLGMKQRVGLAQALLHKPEVLILDEPTNGLDPAGIRELRDILKNLAHQQGVAVLVSSHLLSEMQLMCDRVAIIQNGRVLGVRPIDELLTGAAGKPRQRLTVDDPQAALGALPGPFLPGAHAVNGRVIELSAADDEVPEIVRALVMAGRSIYSVGRYTDSLEDAFLAVTGGGEPIA